VGGGGGGVGGGGGGGWGGGWGFLDGRKEPRKTKKRVTGLSRMNSWGYDGRKEKSAGDPALKENKKKRGLKAGRTGNQGEAITERSTKFRGTSSRAKKTKEKALDIQGSSKYLENSVRRVWGTRNTPSRLRDIEREALRR